MSFLIEIFIPELYHRTMEIVSHKRYRPSASSVFSQSASLIFQWTVWSIFMIFQATFSSARLSMRRVKSAIISLKLAKMKCLKILLYCPERLISLWRKLICARKISIISSLLCLYHYSIDPSLSPRNPCPDALFTLLCFSQLKKSGYIISFSKTMFQMEAL